MDMTLMSTEPHPLSTEIALVLVGLVGYLALRRWRWAAGFVAPIAVLLMWRLLDLLIPILPAVTMPDARYYVLPELGIGVLALLVGVGLPALGWRHKTRSAS